MSVLAYTPPPIRTAYQSIQIQSHIIDVHLVIPIVTPDYPDQCIDCRGQVRLSRCQMLSQFIPSTQNSIPLLLFMGLCILTDFNSFSIVSYCHPASFCRVSFARRTCHSRILALALSCPPQSPEVASQCIETVHGWRMNVSPRPPIFPPRCAPPPINVPLHGPLGSERPVDVHWHRRVAAGQTASPRSGGSIFQALNYDLWLHWLSYPVYFRQNRVRQFRKQRYRLPSVASTSVSISSGSR
jgi:hypothetical protein